MSKITAKVKLVEKRPGWGDGDNRAETLTFAPNYAPGVNESWAAATPSLHLIMSVKGSVADQFEAGNAYTLTFEAEPVADTEAIAEPVAEADAESVADAETDAESITTANVPESLDVEQR